MNLDITQIGKASMILFAVIDIIGSIPIIVGIRQKAQSIYPLRATIISMLIMIGTLFLGESILHIIGININSFAVAGSIVLFIISLEMILGVKIFRDDDISKTAYIVPLAFPIIAGAGTMTSILTIRAEFDVENIIMAIIINCLLVYLVLSLTKTIERILGIGGIAILRKVFGIIIMAMAVKLFSTNIQELFHASN
jgi:multiple antibiotic resistance protein